jgi:hypothetical protein
MSGIQGRAARLMVVALLAVGLVGMHHLVVAACHHLAGHAAHSQMLSMATSTDHGSHGSVPVAPAEVPQPGSDGSPGGLVGAAATCLAILLMVVGLVLPQILARLRRWQVLRFRMAAAPVAARAPKPPDLTLLSVSRT